MKPQRVQLHRALSKRGICSRSKAIPRIRAGEVTVNGKVILDPLFWVNLENDRIHLRSESDSAQKKRKVYLLMNKPAGYVTTADDELERKTVYDLLPERYREDWIFPVGRLDKESRGALLFTNDGPWADKISSPASGCEKRYRILLDVPPIPEKLEVLREGVILDGVKTQTVKIIPLDPLRFDVLLKEGRNRQVRRMFGQIGCTVKDLQRMNIGPITIEGLDEGKTRELSPKEIESL